MNITTIQLFALLQDTVMHIKTGQHLAPNYGYLKNEVLSAFGYNKRASSIKLLACIGNVYIELQEDAKTFRDYVVKHGVLDKYNAEVDRLAKD